MSALATITPLDVLDEQATTDQSDDQDYAGWFCIATAPWQCPAKGCSFIADYITAIHYIIVWPEVDDPSLLAQAKNAKDAGRDPRIVEYEPEFGPCISFDYWRSLGCPVHGYWSEPDGWNPKRRL